MDMIRLLRIDRVLDVRGVKKTKHYSDVASGLWTKPVPISEGLRGWPDNETRELVAARIAGKTDDEIRALVTRLHAMRARLGAELEPT